MDQMEKIETLREKTGCTYTEAKAALEASNGDLLDALCWLEQRGKSMVVGAYSLHRPGAAPGGAQGAKAAGGGRLRAGLQGAVGGDHRPYPPWQPQPSHHAGQAGQAGHLPAGDHLCGAAHWRLLGGAAADGGGAVLRLPLLLLRPPSWGGRISTAPWARPRTLPTTLKRNFSE